MTFRRVLITGIAGGLAQRVAESFIARGHHVVGVDYRAVPKLDGALANMPVVRARYSKSSFEDVFRRQSFDSIIHLGRVGNLREAAGKRFDLNVLGSQKVMDMALQHHVKRLIVLSTFHIYGAHPHNHIPIAEEEPVRAGLDFPEIADAIQLDGMASTWIWKHREVSIAVLRPTNVIGASISNTMSNFLRMKRVPRVLGFDPMSQFIDEADLAAAIVRAEEVPEVGVFNLAGTSIVPWSTAVEIAGKPAVFVPSALAHFTTRFVAGLPTYLVNFLKYPCVISDAAFRETFGWQPVIGLRESIRRTIEAQPQ